MIDSYDERMGADFQGDLDVRGKLPPHDLRAEQRILSSVMTQDPRDYLETVAAILRPEHFFVLAHRLIYEAILNVRENGGQCKPQNVFVRLESLGNADRAGGTEAFDEILGNNLLPRELMPCVNRIMQLWQLRELISVMQDSAAEAYIGVDDVRKFFGDVQKRIAELDQFDEGAKFETLHDVTVTSMREIAEEQKRIAKGEKPETGVRSGLKGLDDGLPGLLPGSLTCVAALSGNGKSAFVLNSYVRTCAEDGNHALFVGLEMSNRESAFRALAAATTTEASVIKHLAMQPPGTFVRGLQQTKAWLDTGVAKRIRMLDKPNVTVEYVASMCRRECERVKRETGGVVKLVAVDYLQIMATSPAVKFGNREQAVAYNTRNLKILAKDLGVALVMLSQLNRESVKNNRRPGMHDLRESDSIGNDSDNVILIHREITTAPDGSTQFTGQEADVIVPKQRSGRRFETKVKFVGQYVRFEDLDVK